MFEKFTEGARRAVFAARLEAVSRGTREIEPAHLLLGILQQGEIVPLFANDLARLETVRSKIAQGLLVGREPLPEKTDIRLAHASKRILAYAAEESERMRHATIASAHLLLGIHRESRGGGQPGILNLLTLSPLPEAPILIEHGAAYDTLHSACRDETARLTWQGLTTTRLELFGHSASDSSVASAVQLSNSSTTAST
jgi:ATP-dependent Clp protease ATP-binding subunit ClpA